MSADLTSRAPWPRSPRDPSRLLGPGDPVRVWCQTTRQHIEGEVRACSGIGADGTYQRALLLVLDGGDNLVPLVLHADGHCVRRDVETDRPVGRRPRPRPATFRPAELREAA